jgi:Undecaprenyl-phosphate glucose phosphotransferase
MANMLLHDNRPAAVAAAGRVHPSASGHFYRIERLVLKIIGMEFVTIALLCLTTSIGYFTVVLNETPPSFEFLAAVLVIPALVVLPAAAFKQYHLIQAQSRDRYMWSGLAAVTLAFALFISLLFVFKVAHWYSRATLLCQFLALGGAILVVRRATHNYIRGAVRAGRLEARRAILVGDVKLHDHVLEKFWEFGIRWPAVLGLPAGISHSAESQLVANGVRSFVEQCRSLKPDDVIFLPKDHELPVVALLSEALLALPVAVHVVPPGLHELWSSVKVTNYGGTIAVQVINPPLSSFDLAVKRCFDLCVASLTLLLLSPLLLMVSLAIKLDSKGPVFFRQNRHGYNNEIIAVQKFRTMKVMEDGETLATFTQARPNDPRVTALGRILRRTNIDELPQLFNVLRGEMSIVGPRPHPIALNELFRDRIAPFSRRHNVKPGLTGWAQVSGLRGNTDTFEKMRRRIEHDLFYIDNWSFVLDLKIILMTIFSKTAYTNAC